MQRVAALFLPQWPIERLRREDARNAPPEPRAPADPAASLDPLLAAAAKEQEHACSVPRGGGWRPGARWAREERARQIAALPAHQRPTIRELGRSDVAARPPFRAMRPDEGGAPSFLPGMGSGTGRRLVEGTPRSGAAAGPSTTRYASGTPPRSVEELGPPLVTAIRTGNRQRIAAACPAARAQGLAPGMAITQARMLVPGLDIRPADPEGDVEALRRLAVALARRWCPVVTRDGADGLLLDITGTAHLFGGEARMARRLLRLLGRMGHHGRIAIADTAGAAHALARHSNSGICPPGRQAEALAGLPVAALRIGEFAVELLRRLGVDTIGQLAAMPRAPLARRFGLDLVRRLDQALGDAPEPIDPIVPAEEIAVERRFAEPIASPEAIAHWLGTLVPELCAALEAQGLGARAVELVAARVDGVPQRIRVGLARPVRDPFHLLRLIARRIETIAPGYGIDALSLHVRRSEPLAPQPLGEVLDQDAPDLATLLDTLATRIGLAAMWRARPIESDVPERAVGKAEPLDTAEPGRTRAKIDAVAQLDRSPAQDPWHPEWPKPARLLRRPERLDHVLAELPDHAPRRFTWRGQSHRIVRADGPERIHGEWWRRRSETHSVRDYFRVEDDAGRRYWLFRRGDGERQVSGDLSWYLHGVFG